MGLGSELEGYTIVSIEQAVAAPYCGLLLADAGARVIKIERTEGDFARAYDRAAKGVSAYFVWLNRGKESVCLNLDDDEDVTLLRKMVDKADVLLHNLAPGSMEKRGFSGEDLRKTNAGLVTCEITGYGRAGPYAEMKAYDLLVQAEAGLCAVTGTHDSPARVGVSLCDIATGLTAFSAILRALLLRSRTGKGVDLSIAMFDVLADWMNVPLLYQRYTGNAPGRLGVAHATLAPYGLYAAANDESLLIAIQSNREWRTFCDLVLKNPGLGNDSRFINNEDRVKNRPEMDSYINEVFAGYNRDVLIGILKSCRIACANLSSVSDLESHPQLRNIDVDFNGLKITLADLPVKTDNSRATLVPTLGEHTSAIRAEFNAESST